MDFVCLLFVWEINCYEVQCVSLTVYLLLLLLHCTSYIQYFIQCSRLSTKLSSVRMVQLFATAPYGLGGI